MAAGRGVLGSLGSGTSALVARPRTRPGVSAPSSVVRSIIEMAVSMAHALLVVLIDRVASEAARSSQPTWSTPGSPWSHELRALFVRRETPSRSRARSEGAAVVVLTRRVYGRRHPADTACWAAPGPVGRTPRAPAAGSSHRSPQADDGGLTSRFTSSRRAG